MEIKVEKRPASTTILTITVPSQKVAEAFQQAFLKAGEETEVPGFRKGKAPLDILRTKIPLDKVSAKIFDILVPSAVETAIKEHHLRPIIEPRVHFDKIEENKPFAFTATIVEKPEISLGDYQKALKEAYKAKAGAKIAVAHSLSEAEKEEKRTETPLTTEEILKVINKEAKMEIPDILKDEEVNRMLSRLVDQTGKLGLTVEQYLASIKKTGEELKQEYGKIAEETLKSEFALTEIALKEGIEAKPEEIEEAIKSAPDEKSRAELEKEENRWYIRSILIKTKTISFLERLSHETT